MGGLCCHCIFPSTASRYPTSRLNGRVAFVTGVTRGGIGYETARVLASRGAHVILAGRRMKDLEDSRDAIISSIIGGCCSCCKKKDQDEIPLTCISLDLSSFASIRQCAEQFLAMKLPLDLLVNNAGILSPGYVLCEKADNVESQMQINYLGHFYLTLLLLENIRAPRLASASEPSEPRLPRIINVSSTAHMQGRLTLSNVASSFSPTKEQFDNWTSYGNSKLANILHAKYLASHYPQIKGNDSRGIIAYSLHPGVISSNLGMSEECYIRCFCYCCICCLKSIDQGTATTIHACFVPPSDAINGCYFDDCSPTNPMQTAQDPKLAEALWKESMKRVLKWEKEHGYTTVKEILRKEESEGMPSLGIDLDGDENQAAASSSSHILVAVAPSFNPAASSSSNPHPDASASSQVLPPSSYESKPSEPILSAEATTSEDGVAN